MDGSLGLQGTKPSFMGLADLIVGWGEASCQGKSKVWELQRPHFRRHQHFLHKWPKPSEKYCSDWNWGWNKEWWTSARAVSLTLCPNEAAVKECDFLHGVGTSSPSLQGHGKESVFNPWLLLICPLLAQLISCDHLTFGKTDLWIRKVCHTNLQIINFKTLFYFLSFFLVLRKTPFKELEGWITLTY